MTSHELRTNFMKLIVQAVRLHERGTVHGRNQDTRGSTHHAIRFNFVVRRIGRSVRLFESQRVENKLSLVMSNGGYCNDFTSVTHPWRCQSECNERLQGIGMENRLRYGMLSSKLDCRKLNYCDGALLINPKP